MNNLEKLKQKIANMSVEEFAKTRIETVDTMRGVYEHYGDWNDGDGYDFVYADAIKKEIDWLLEEVKS